MADAGPLAQLIDAAGLKSTDDVLGVVSLALKNDRKKLRSLVGDARSKLGKAARQRVDKELKQALSRLQGTNRATKTSTATAKVASAIRGAKVAPVAPLPMSLDRVLKLKAPAGRRVRVRPGPAEHRELVELARVTDANARRAHAALAHHSRSITALAIRQEKLAATQREMARLIAELQSRGDLALLEGLLSGLGTLGLGLDRCKKRIKASERSTRSQLGRQVKGVETKLGSLVRANRIQKLNDAASTMQSAAFGTKGNLLARNNLTIAGNQVLWGLLGDVLQGLGLASPGSPSPAAWLAPIASLVTSQATLGNRQHERFISGVAEEFVVRGFSTATATISLQPFVATGFWREFQTRTDVIVTLTAISMPDEASLLGEVVNGVLTITVDIGLGGSGGPAEFVGTRVAWVVDTGEG